MEVNRRMESGGGGGGRNGSAAMAPPPSRGAPAPMSRSVPSSAADRGYVSRKTWSMGGPSAKLARKDIEIIEVEKQTKEDWARKEELENRQRAAAKLRQQQEAEAEWQRKEEATRRKLQELERKEREIVEKERRLQEEIRRKEDARRLEEQRREEDRRLQEIRQREEELLRKEEKLKRMEMERRRADELLRLEDMDRSMRREKMAAAAGRGGGGSQPGLCLGRAVHRGPSHGRTPAGAAAGARPAAVPVRRAAGLRRPHAAGEGRGRVPVRVARQFTGRRGR